MAQGVGVRDGRVGPKCTNVFVGGRDSVDVTTVETSLASRPEFIQDVDVVWIVLQQNLLEHVTKR